MNHQPQQKTMNKEQLSALLHALSYSRKRARLIDELVAAAAGAGFEPPQLMEYIVKVSESPVVSIVANNEINNNEETYVTLRKELTTIKNSGWDFFGCYFPEEGIEFCSEEGNILDLAESELTKQQAKFLAVIRKHYRRYINRRPV